MTDHPKEHGLLFKPDMVRAYLAGNKSQTRRVITRRNSYVDGEPTSKEFWEQLQFDRAWVDPGPSPAGNLGPYLKVPRPWIEGGKQVDESVHRVYPRFQVGDMIWGRETWATGRGYDGVRPRDLPSQLKRQLRIAYRADGSESKWVRGEWRPSIFLPRWASRIVTPIIAVRPERVQDISESDAREEGCPLIADDQNWSQCRRWFCDLWEEINGKKYPWSSNPLVWAVTFKAYEK